MSVNFNFSVWKSYTLGAENVSFSKQWLKGLSSEISAAKTGTNRYVSVIGCGAEIFS
jgi:hypothetical protein